MRDMMYLILLYKTYMVMAEAWGHSSHCIYNITYLTMYNFHNAYNALTALAAYNTICVTLVMWPNQA